MPWKAAPLLLAVSLATACESGPLSPGEHSASLVEADGLITELTVEPDDVAPGGTFTATYSIHNPHDEPVDLDATCAALANGVVYRDGEEVRFLGSGSGCYTAISHREIAGGETLERTWTVTAAVILRAYPDGREPDVAPAEPGDYVFRVEPNVFRVNGANGSIPPLEEEVVVR